MFLNNSNHLRNLSAFSKRSSDKFSKRSDINKLSLKISNSKTTLQICPSERSQSQTNQTINNIAFTPDIESPRLSEFHIKTFIRFKPEKNNNPFQSRFSQISSNKKVAIIDKKKILCEDNFFAYDRVFQSHSQQQEVYNSVCKQMVQHFVRGFNSTIFAYGQTGSGKTYTMFGQIADQFKKGVIPSAVKDIYSTTKFLSNQENQQPNSEIIISCSMLQIYKETMIDLLSNQKSELKIKQNQFFNVSNLTTRQVLNEDEMYEVLRTGNQSKKIRETHMNQVSSRSHVIFTIYLQVRKQNQKRLSKFNFVDLAGSQKVSKSKVEGQGLQEAKKINLSLSCLGNTINALLKKNDHIPYRQSKLTRLLFESLGGNSLTRLIVTCSSQDSQIEQTLGSLKFASRAKNLKTNPLINTLRKSQKSVSRIAYQNIKTNLNKAQLKIKKIRSIVKQLKQTEKQHVIPDQHCKKQFYSQQNKENDFSSSNLQNQIDTNKNEEFLKIQSFLKNYKKCVQNIESTLSSNNMDIFTQPQHRQERKKNHLGQTLQNPFLLISQNQQNDFHHQQPRQNIHMQLKNNPQDRKPLKLKKDILTEDKNTNNYWEIIKMQQKQINQLKRKLTKIQNLNINRQQTEQNLQKFINESKFMSTKECSQVQSRKNSVLFEFQNSSNNQQHGQFDIKLQKIKKDKNMIIKLQQKLLPVRQIYLTSPVNNSSQFKKNMFKDQNQKTSLKKSGQKRSSTQNCLKYLSNIIPRQGQCLNSPRQFILTEYNEEIGSNEFSKNQNNLQNLIKQISKKIKYRDEYEGFERKILTRQANLLLQTLQKTKLKDKINIKVSQQHQSTKEKDHQNQIIDKQFLLILQQTNQQVKSQNDYIEKLQNILLKVSNNDKNITHQCQSHNNKFKHVQNALECQKEKQSQKGKILTLKRPNLEHKKQKFIDNIHQSAKNTQQNIKKVIKIR